eukprot:COSAG05_NODE_11732_length_499_cov_1.262500_2_plen_72_part_01
MDWSALEQKRLCPPWAPATDNFTSSKVLSATSEQSAPRIRVICGDVATSAREYRTTVESEDDFESDEVDSDD